MTPPRTFFTYLRLKIAVTVMRVIVPLVFWSRFRRDRLLAQKLGFSRERVRIPTREPGRVLDADLYCPDPSTAPQRPRPVLVNWHGSGYLFPLLGSDVLFCSRIAREAGIFVLDADYRKAPETPFPGALHDAEDSLLWVATQTDRFDASRVALSGFSAGAALALAMASSTRKSLEPILNIAAVSAIYPPTDFSISLQDKVVPGIPMPPAFALGLMYEGYAPDKDTWTDPRMSPCLADPAAFPPSVSIVTCEADYLAVEGMALARKLEDGQRTVIAMHLQSVGHAFDRGAKEGTIEWESREEAYTAVTRMLIQALR